MTVTDIPNEEAWHSTHAKADNKLVVVDFTATWCGPCKSIAPIFHELAAKYGSQAVFCKVDVDAVASVAQKEKIEAMPTFGFYVSKKQVEKVVGADAGKLKLTVETLVKKYSVFASKGYSLLSGSGSSKSAGNATTKRFNPWADPNFVPPGMGQLDASVSIPDKMKHKPKQNTTHQPQTPWTDPSFMPKPIQSAPEAKTSAQQPVKKPETAADDDLARAIAMSLDSETTNPGAQNGPSLVKMIDQNLLSELLAMGFARVRSEKALILSKVKSVEAATNWLIEHEQDADIDEPLQILSTAPSANSNLEEDFDEEDSGLAEAIRSTREKAAKAKEEARKQAVGDQDSVDMSTMTKEEKLAYIERLKAVRKEQRAKEAIQEAKEKEIQRQQNAKAALEAKRVREEQQASMAAARAKREKDAEKARQKRIEDKLRADKEARIKARLERENQNAKAKAT